MRDVRNSVMCVITGIHVVGGMQGGSSVDLVHKSTPMQGSVYQNSEKSYF